MKEMCRLKIGITCFPSIGGSGILASRLGEELASRGHEIHFISYERPARMKADSKGIFFHEVKIQENSLFKYPDYTLPLSVKMAEVSRAYQLDILHVHYAVPHATAAFLARSMLPSDIRPRLITTLHGTDTLLLGLDPGYGPAIRHALEHSDAVTAVSEFLKRETQNLFHLKKHIDVIYNFYTPSVPGRSPATVRRELGLTNELVILHSSNLRPPKRIDLLLEATVRIRSRENFKLVILAGDDFSKWRESLKRLKIEDRVVVVDQVKLVEDYLQIADLGFYTSDSESFCLGILEAMSFGVPSVSTRVGGVPEVMEDRVSGLFAPAGDVEALAAAASSLLGDVARRKALGRAALTRAKEIFSADIIVAQYESLYHRVLELEPRRTQKYEVNSK